MQNKPAHRWFDVQVIIAFLAMVSSLVLWNVFAKNTQITAAGSNTLAQAPASVSSSAPMPQTRITFGNPAPQQQAPSFVNAPAAPSFAPAPVTTTGSSRP